MRLLHFEGGVFDSDRVTLVEFFGSDIPQYGILSHTWGADEEEVTLQDVMEGTCQHKTGYNEIRSCGTKANKELQYFWIDTCCIDRSNRSELQEAINSMFHWYQNSAVCYVYLSDVSDEGFVSDYKSWDGSRWFERGWTLQELLAPKHVEFFSFDGEYLGSRQSQAPRIQKATGIHKRRRTTCKEDAAYCLLGLLNVHMAIEYGERREQALLRLQKRINESQDSTGHLKPIARSVRRLIHGKPKQEPALIPSLERIKNLKSEASNLPRDPEKTVSLLQTIHLTMPPHSGITALRSPMSYQLV